MTGPTTTGRVVLAGIGKRFGDFAALENIDLAIEPGEFFSLLGPSGSGKTTTLRIIAGLETPDGGTVSLDGRDITHLSPGGRDAAMVFQSYALYPHMSVARNIGFPLRMVGTPKAEIDRLVLQAAERVDIAHLLDRRPGQLSGGQQQRCALGRAIVRSPKLFLLDEPLSNLDARLRMQTRVELKKLQRTLGVTAIYVTHDQEEAMTLSDRMAIFMAGRIVQVGTPEEVYRRPVSTAVAGFLGSPPMNLIPATLDGDRLDFAGVSVTLPRRVEGFRGEVVVGVRPADIGFAADGIPATVELAELLGDDMILDLRVSDTLVKARLMLNRRFAEGEAVRIAFVWSRLHFFGPEGARLDLAYGAG
ncbi:MAG TPA: ABC transporter ATP-binding protein [Stellaceae bacterium]|jgi:ABC-type sugar transport system ATPase subunit